MMKLKVTPIALAISTLILSGCTINISTNSDERVAPAKVDAELNEIFTVDEFVEDGFKSGNKSMVKITSITCYNNSCAFSGDGEWAFGGDESTQSFYTYSASEANGMILEVEPDCDLTEETCHSVKNISVIRTGEQNPYDVEEIKYADLALPADVHSGQIINYFKQNGSFFALAAESSMNLPLSYPSDFTPSFKGILKAEPNQNKWTKVLKIEEINPSDKNNPYYLFNDQTKRLLTVVDANGAGSGEGMMKVFDVSDFNKPQLEGCYYFGEKYHQNFGEYLAFSSQLSRQSLKDIKLCENVELIPVQ